MNNRAIRTAMFRIGLRQYQLAEILGCSEASVSLMLRHELSRAEQKRIVDLIKEYEASDEKREHVMKEKLMNNRAIRTAMFRIGLRQYQLAEILGCSEASVSLMLRHELSRAEQKRIVDLIKEYEASDEKREHVMSEISTLSELNQEHENEVIVKLTSDHIKMKGGEYVQDLVRWTDASVG